MTIRIPTDKLKITRFERDLKIRDYRTESLNLTTTYYPLNAIRHDYKCQFTTHDIADELYLEGVLANAFYSKEKVEFLIPKIVLHNPDNTIDEFNRGLNFVLNADGMRLGDPISAGATRILFNARYGDVFATDAAAVANLINGRLFQLINRNDDGELADSTIYTITNAVLTPLSDAARFIDFYPPMKNSATARNEFIATTYDIYYVGTITKYKHTRRSQDYQSSTFDISMEGVA